MIDESRDSVVVDRYYKIGPLLQIGAKFITNWGRYYKLGHNMTNMPPINKKNAEYCKKYRERRMENIE